MTLLNDNSNSTGYNNKNKNDYKNNILYIIYKFTKIIATGLFWQQLFILFDCCRLHGRAQRYWWSS